MRIGLHDGDGQTDFPNYALMKISAWHKAKGDAVEWWNPLLTYDRVYSSKVFTFTPECPYLPDDTINVHVKVNVSEQFFGWLAGLREARIVSPSEVKEKYLDHLHKILENQQK